MWTIPSGRCGRAGCVGRAGTSPAAAPTRARARTTHDTLSQAVLNVAHPKVVQRAPNNRAQSAHCAARARGAHRGQVWNLRFARSSFARFPKNIERQREGGARRMHAARTASVKGGRSCARTKRGRRYARAHTSQADAGSVCGNSLPLKEERRLDPCRRKSDELPEQNEANQTVRRRAKSLTFRRPRGFRVASHRPRRTKRSQTRAWMRYRYPAVRSVDPPPLGHARTREVGHHAPREGPDAPVNLNLLFCGA